MESCSGTGFHSFSERKSNGGYETANTTFKKTINISNHLRQILKKIWYEQLFVYHINQKTLLSHSLGPPALTRPVTCR